MKHNIKRILSLALCAVMVFGLVSIIPGAVEAVTDTDNLVPNSGFEEGTRTDTWNNKEYTAPIGWAIPAEGKPFHVSANTAFQSVVDDPLGINGKVLKVEFPSASQDSFGMWPALFPVTPGQRLTISFDMLGTGEVGISRYILDANRKNIGTGWVKGTKGTDTAWKNFTFDYTIPEGAAFAAFGIYIGSSNYGKLTMADNVTVKCNHVMEQVDTGTQHGTQCKYCGRTEGEMQDHVYDQEVMAEKYWVSSAACETPSVYYKSCLCGAKGTETFNGTSFDHILSEEPEVITPATCDEPGVVAYKCVVVGCDYAVEEETSALGHDLSEATCTVPASCQREGCDYVEEATKPHTFTTKASDKLATGATCTSGNTYFVACDVCGAVSETETVVVGEAKGHSFTTKASDKVATAGDCETAPTYYVQCDNCDAVSDTVTVAGVAAGHTLTAVAAKEATVDAEGNIAYWTCKCGKWFADAEGKTEITDKASVIIPKLDSPAEPSEPTEPSEPGDVPPGGDETALALMMTLLVLSGAALVVTKFKFGFRK